jgi:hypothetical protein
VLAKRGIELVYTDKAESLNAKALVVYRSVRSGSETNPLLTGLLRSDPE